MTEAFLHYIWAHQLFDKKDLISTNGLSLEVVKPGEHNTHAGPDFFSARIRINDTLWVGTVEIHLKASEWKKHKHEQDAAYDNCILHVVYEYDEEAFRKNGQAIYCLELKGRFSEKVWENYQVLLGTASRIPCSHRITEVKPILINTWLDRLAVERLEKKTEQVYHLLSANNNDWEETFYQFLCAGFGFQINSLPFTMLSRNLPFKLILKYRDSQSLLESLLFGCAGFLDEEVEDLYFRRLREDFDSFKKAHELKTLDISSWKFLRLRPVNFPTIRLSQIASLFSGTDSLFSQTLDQQDLKAAKRLFEVGASAYWDSHFVFAKRSETRRKMLGQGSIDNIFINVIIPILFAYGKRKNLQVYMQKALSFLEQIAAEDNAIIKNWTFEGIKPQSALQSQALLELNKYYCKEKKCLTCRIGIELINKLP
jgi:hypothetical protein